MDNDTLNNSETREKVKVTQEDLVNRLLKEFEKPFFKGKDDLKAAAGLGLYFNNAAYLQKEVLGNQSLLKNTRTWLKVMDKDALLKIFAECNRIMFAVANKEGSSTVRNGLIRQKLIEPYLLSDNWHSSSEKLLLAFMIGYDIYSVTYQEQAEQ